MVQADVLERIAVALERIADQFDPMRREDADPYDPSGHCVHCGAPDMSQNPLSAAPMPQDDELYFADAPEETPEQTKIREQRDALKVVAEV